MPLPFLRSQRLYGLRPEADPRETLHPERFHAARNRPGEREDASPSTQDDKLWEALPRAAFLAGDWNGKPLHRIALTTDAGIGKTYNLRWLHHELNLLGRPVLAFSLKIGALTSVADLIEKKLVPLVRKALGTAGSDDKRLERDLDRKRAAGDIVLLFDELDHAGDASVDLLAGLLYDNEEWAKCRIVVAGRPYALDRHWDRLFNEKRWQFVQIAEFDEKQQRAVLGRLADGRDRFDAIPHEARSLFTVPRVLEYIRSLPEDQLAGLRTVADVYWRATGYMLTQAIGERPSLIEMERYRALLGALAFGMYSRTETDPKAGLRPNLDRIAASQMTSFQVEVHGKLEQAFCYHCLGPYPFGQFEADCRTLSDLNALLNHGWLDVSKVGDPDTDLLWRNASLAEYFSAYWATRWGEPKDLDLLRHWIVNPLTDKNRGFYWFWRYASEMPDMALNERTSRATWVRAMAPLYDQTAVRSTEFIYRSWDRMKDTAPQKTFLAEFSDLLAKKRGTPKQQRIAHTMMDGFIALVGSGLPGDTGTFWMGSANDDPDAYDDEKPPREVNLKQYRLHPLCVMNVEFELFNEEHSGHRWEVEKVHPLAKQKEDEKSGDGDDRCPVVNVSWFDAFCFAAFCGCQLPTEAQWEYACRAGTTTPYAVGDGHTLTAKDCHFNQDWKTEHTIPVDGKPANTWEFYQMHGNVWEWCIDWYDSEQVCRVLRGGSWYYYAWYCRAAYRHWSGPRYRYRYFGFRLCLPGPV